MNQITITLTTEESKLLMDCLEADIETMDNMTRWNKDPGLLELIEKAKAVKQKIVEQLGS